MLTASVSSYCITSNPKTQQLKAPFSWLVILRQLGPGSAGCFCWAWLGSFRHRWLSAGSAQGWLVCAGASSEWRPWRPVWSLILPQAAWADLHVCARLHRDAARALEAWIQNCCTTTPATLYGPKQVTYQPAFRGWGHRLFFEAGVATSHV